MAEEIPTNTAGSTVTSPEKKEVITIKKESVWKYSTFLLLALLIVGGILFFTKGNSTSTGNVVQNPTVQPPSQPPSQGARVQVSADDDPVLGNKDAKVTIIEFSDYQCPFCGRFYSQTLPQIKSEYIDTGKAKLVFRDFPLDSIHPMATPAAMAAECVKEQGKEEGYYKFHDKVFENQQDLNPDNLKKWAKDLGYNIDSCLDSGKYKSEVQKDFSEGSAAGVRGTPAFFINGKILEGAQPFEAFKQAIDPELA